jgi:hypothetical protein
MQDRTVPGVRADVFRAGMMAPAAVARVALKDSVAI